MTIVLRPVGRGNWKPVPLVFPNPDLFPALRDCPPRVGQPWVIDGKKFRVSEVRN